MKISPRIRPTTIENPVSPAAALVHLVAEHGWDEHTPVDPVMVMGHKLAHGRHGHLDLADADLLHAHPGVVSAFLRGLYQPVGPFEVVKTWEEDEDGNIIPAEPVVPVVAPTKLSDLSTSEKVVIGAGVALGLGPFLPWLTVSAPLIGTISRSGMSEPFDLGWLAILFGFALVMATLKRQPTLSLIAAIGAAIFAFAQYSDVTDRITAVRGSSSLVAASVGNGIWLMGAAAAAGIIASLHARRDAEAEWFAAQFLDTDDDTECV